MDEEKVPEEKVPIEEKNICPCCDGLGYIKVIKEAEYSLPKKTKKKKED